MDAANHIAPQEEEPAEESDWAPDRFNQHGFKYQALGTKKAYLNHPNKVNYAGFLYGLKSPGSFKSKTGNMEKSLQDIKL